MDSSNYILKIEQLENAAFAKDKTDYQNIEELKEQLFNIAGEYVQNRIDMYIFGNDSENSINKAKRVLENLNAYAAKYDLEAFVNVENAQMFLKTLIVDGVASDIKENE